MIFINKIIFVLVLTLFQVSGNLVAQHSVVGRVFAEIVESVEAKSEVVTDLSLTKISSDKENMLKLGHVLVISNRSYVYDLIISDRKLSDSKSNNVNIEITAESNSLLIGDENCNSRIVELKGSASLLERHKNDVLKGTYTMVFAYN